MYFVPSDYCSSTSPAFQYSAPRRAITGPAKRRKFESLIYDIPDILFKDSHYHRDLQYHIGQAADCAMPEQRNSIRRRIFFVASFNKPSITIIIMKNSLCIRLSLNIGSNVCFFKKFDHFSWCDDKMLSWKMLDVSCILRLFHCCKEE